MSADIKALNTQLATVSYLGGVYPTQKDAETFKTIKLADLDDAPYVKRWYLHICSFTECERKNWKADETETEKKDEDEDFDLFGDEDSEEERRREEDFDRRAREAQARIDAKKAKSGKVEVAKSMCILEVKPIDDETDLQKVAEQVVAIQIDGLKWGEYKFVDIAFGLKKVQVGFVIEDEKVPSTEDITDQIAEFDGVQSADVVSINKM